MIKILIIEDDLTFSQILEGFLNKNGYKTILSNEVEKEFNND
jgi:two-component system response regulator HydG